MVIFLGLNQNPGDSFLLGAAIWHLLHFVLVVPIGILPGLGFISVVNCDNPILIVFLFLRWRVLDLEIFHEKTLSS